MMQKQFPDDDDNDDDLVNSYKSRLLKCMNFGDVGKFTYGRPGLIAVDAALVFTQFGFCISYFIFVGNTLQNVFPSVLSNRTEIDNCSFINNTNSSSPAQTDESFNVDMMSNITGSIWRISSAPSLKLLVLFPLPLFLLFTFVRRLRNLGGISVVANLCIFFGYFAVIYILSTGK